MAVTGATADQTQYFWILITERPEGSLASNGVTVSQFGLAKRAGHPSEHPVLKFLRAYHEAKNRLYDAHGFPEATAGRPQTSTRDICSSRSAKSNRPYAQMLVA